MIKKKYKVLFIGGTRYSNPLEPTHEKKIKAMAEKLDMTFIGMHLGRERGYLKFSQGADFHLVPSAMLNYIRQAYFLVFAFFKGLWLIKKKKIQVVVCQSPFEGISGAFLRIFYKRVKLVVEIHGEWDIAPVAYQRLSHRFKWISDRIGRWAINKSDSLRVISEATHKTVEEFNKPVFVFPAYTDIELFLEEREQDPIPNRFIFIGQMIRLKGIVSMIEAVSILERKNIIVEILMVGEGDDMALFKDQIRREGLHERFVFLGKKSQKELAELIKSSMALILPSFTEGLGRVIIESFACSRLAIGSRVGGIPGLIQDQINGMLFEAGESLELAGKLEYAVHHTLEIKQMGARGRESVENSFSTQMFADNYYQMIAQTIAKNE
jgi:glycosyltransferase involved in cell wall biosynthesis